MTSLGASGKALGSSGKAILADLGAILADLGAILADRPTDRIYIYKLPINRSCGPILYYTLYMITHMSYIIYYTSRITCNILYC